MKFAIHISSEEELAVFARTLAKRFQGGEIIELIGDVGAGKTTLTRYFVEGLGSEDPVSSPTFTINNLYHGAQFPIYHFDFYRLGSDDSLIKHELQETVAEDNAIVILEWASAIDLNLDKPSISISIQATSESERDLTIDIPEAYSYIGGSA